MQKKQKTHALLNVVTCLEKLRGSVEKAVIEYLEQQKQLVEMLKVAIFLSVKDNLKHKHV